MAILSYFTRFTMKRGNAGSWNSGWKRSKRWKPILHNSESPETPRNNLLELLRISERKKYTKGPPPCPRDRGTPRYRARPLSPRPPDGPPVAFFCYIIAFTLEKIVGKLPGRTSAATRRNLGETNLGLWRSCSAGGTSLREGESSPSSSPTILSSGGGQYPSTSSPAPSHLKP